MGFWVIIANPVSPVTRSGMTPIPTPLMAGLIRYTQPGWTFPTVLTNGNWAAMPLKLQVANIKCENCHGAGSEQLPCWGIPTPRPGRVFRSRSIRAIAINAMTHRRTTSKALGEYSPLYMPWRVEFPPGRPAPLAWPVILPSASLRGLKVGRPRTRASRRFHAKLAMNLMD